MKLHLNLCLRRALLAAMAAVGISAPHVTAGMADARYDLQYYLDFSYNKGMFSVGATNILVKYADGTSVTDASIPIMPNLDCYAEKGTVVGALGLSAHGGGSLVAPQYVMSAAHCLETDIFFLTENGDTSTKYTSGGYYASGSWGIDWSVQRLNKIVTEVAYTPFATDAFMSSLTVGTWMYRLGHGQYYNTSGELLNTNQNALGGLINLENNLKHLDANTWEFITHIRLDDTAGDVRPPLEIGALSGDSGSPIFAWDDANNCFVQVAFASAGTLSLTYGNDIWCRYNAVETQNFIDTCTIEVSGFSGENIITWGEQDAATGTGTLSQLQGDTTVVTEYTGYGSNVDIDDQKGLTFSTTDTDNVQTLALQSSVNMGAGALTFDSGNWKITEAQTSDTFNSAGFVVNKGASVTLNLTATASEEWRKVGEGILTIAGEGNNEVVLRVGGGTTVYNVVRDAETGAITGCTLGNAGETRLDRTNGYAASSVRLEGGVAILVLMQDAQFKTNSLAGDTFTFGNAGGLLNLNGHNLSWAVINQSGSGTGARIGNFTPEGLTTPGLATFTYTGTDTFEGSFMDEGAGDGKAQLAVVYNNTGNGSWKLTGNHTNVGGYTVQGGTLVLEGSLTPHVNTTDTDDWTYASIEGSDVSVESGAAFQLSHHAVMTGNVEVQDGGSFILNQTVNAASESIQGSLRQDMTAMKLTSLVGNVDLYGSATMTINADSCVLTTMKGNITHHNTTAPDASYFVKNGSGIFVVNGSLSVMSGTVNAGGLVAADASAMAESTLTQWTIGEQGFMAFGNVDNDTALTYVSADSCGVLALTRDQTTALAIKGTTDRSHLIIGAWGEVNYGTLTATLDTVTDTATAREVWRLGGGTGTLNVLFKLTGDADLYIGNEWSSGTVNLANTANDFTGLIYLRGLGNMLEYEVDEAGNTALGSARVSLGYGSAIALQKAEQLDILDGTPKGILALATNVTLDLSPETLSQVSIGAKGDFTYSTTLTVADTYRFGGSGNLTLDTTLDGAESMRLDGQGTSGSSVTFARENAYCGSMIAGGGLELAEANSSGDIAIHVGHENALAAAASIILQKGAILYTDGQNLTANNLSLESGATLRNNGNTLSQVTLNVSDTQSTSVADGVLNSSSDSAQLNLIKSGSGTLTMATNADWTGTLVIHEGTVKGTLAASDTFITTGGIGSSDSVIYVEDEGILKIQGATRNGRALGGTEILQTVLGTGTIEFSTGGSAFFSTQATSFEGTLKLVDNTRLYMGVLNYNGMNSKNTYKSLDQATVHITDGSQVRITPSFYELSTTQLSINTDFIISGTGFAGVTDSSTDMAKLDLLTEGALAIDFNAIVKGNITLADHATISSSSNSFSSSGAKVNTGYGIKNYMGGTIRGLILGTTGEEILTIGGNEGMTITADSANTFGDLIISNGNGNNTDQFALRLNNGQAMNQVSTALGTGTVTVETGLILRLAGTGVANNTGINYTYENAFKVDNNATLQSYNITNTLTGTVTMQGTTLNLATAQGGVLVLAGGIQGSGTLNIGADSTVVLGSAAATLSLARTTTPQFSGTVVAESGADITLASPSVVSTETVFTGTDSLILRLSGQDDYTLGGISVAASGESDSLLTLHFDFTNTPVAGEADSWTTLTSNISAGATSIVLDLNMFNDIVMGEYTLITSIDNLDSFTLANTLNGRLALAMSDTGALVLTVGEDNRLYWRTNQVSDIWNTTDANWYSDKAEGMTLFSNGADVVLDGSGVAAGNSAEARETITVTDTLTVGTLAAQDSAYEITGDGSINANALAVGEEGDLKLSNTGVNTFTDGVQIDNGKLEVSGSTLTADVTTVNGAFFALSAGTAMTGNLNADCATVSVNDSSLSGAVTLSGTAALQMLNATLNGTLSSETGSVTLDSAKLSGDLSNGTNALQSSTLTIMSGAVTTNVRLNMGSLSLQGGSLQINEAANIDTLSIAAGTTVTLWNATAAAGADKVLGTVELANGAILQTNDREIVTNATSIGTLNLTGTSATLRDSHHSGWIQIDDLTLADGLGTATLVLDKKASSSNMTTYVLGDSAVESEGSFVGTIELKSSPTVDSNSGDRSAGIVLSNKDIARNAVILLSSNTSSKSGSYLALGVNADNAYIAGLESGAALAARTIVYSGSLNANEAWADANIDGNRTNTLTICTKENKTHDFYGQVYGGLNLILDGEGTQRFLGESSSFCGSLTIQGGTVAFNASGSSLLSAASAVTVGAATLDLSAIDFSDSANAIALGTEAAYTFAADSTIALGALDANTQYNIFTVGSASLTGWTTLTASNFTLNGMNLADYGRTVVVSPGMLGTFEYSVTYGNIIWTGGESGTWNTVDSNTVWTEITDGMPAELPTRFHNLDHVTFQSAANVTLEEDINAGSVTLAKSTASEADFTVELNENTGSLTSSSISVGEGTTLRFTTEKNGYTAANISGTGVVELALTSAWSNKVQPGTSFNGETYVTSGYLDLYGATPGHTLRLANGVNANSSAKTTVEFNIILEGESIVHANSNSPITYNGTVTGDNGVFCSNGSTSHTFTKTVNLAGFKTAHATNTTNFNGNTTLGTASITQANVNFNGTTHITTANISGGTSIFGADGSADITTAVFSGGTVSFNGATTLTTASFNGGTVNFSTNSLSIGTFNRGAGAVNFKPVNGSEPTTYTVGDIVGNAPNGTITVYEGVTLNVSNINYQNSSNNGGTRTLTVNGILNVTGYLKLNYGLGENINGTGVMNIGGNATFSPMYGNAVNINVDELNIGGNLILSSYNTPNSETAFNISSGITTVQGTVNHTSNGASNYGEYVALNINGGSLVMQGGATMSKGELNISDGSLVLAGGTATISNTFSMTGGALNVTGGEMTISSTPTVSGGSIAISGGELALASAEVANAVLSGTDTIALSGSGSLNLSGITFSTESQLTLGAALTVSGDGILNLGKSLNATDTIYRIFTMADGVELDWVNMGANIIVNDTYLCRYTGATLAVTDNVATLTFTSLDKTAVVWSGGETGNWDTSSYNWDLGVTDSDASNNTTFLMHDDVIFANSATVTISDGLIAKSLELKDNVALTTDGAVEISGSIVSGTGASWTLSESTVQSLTWAQASAVSALIVSEGATLKVSNADGYTAANISGTGLVELALTSAWSNKVQPGTSFNGETYVTSGYLDLYGATPGHTLRLANGVNANSSAKTTVEFNIILEGESIVHANSNNPITYNGTVTGDNGVFCSNGSTSHTFTNTVNLAGFKTAHKSNTTNFNGNTTLGTATITQANVNFNGTTHITTADISGGTTIFGADGSADITTANISGGTTTFKGDTTVGTLNQTAGKVVVNGQTEVTGRLNGTGGTLAITGNELVLAYTGTDGNVVSILDGSAASTATGTLRLKGQASLEVSSQLWGRTQSSVVLEQEASLSHAGLVFSNKNTEAATLKATAEDQKFSTDSENWQLSGGHLKSTSESGLTVATLLSNSSVENAGNGELIVNHADNSITDAYATAGNLKILQQATTMKLGELVLAEGQTVSVYTGLVVDAAYEGTVSVAEMAMFGLGATLNANLILNKGATLEVADGGLSMGSTLTLYEGITLGVDTLARVKALSVGESLNLFSGVDGLTLSDTAYNTISESDSILASTYFSNLGSNNYVLTYTGANNGILGITMVSIPEPSSAILGMVGITLLSFRRRRPSR